MSEYRPANTNRLLELEQELLGQRRLAEIKKRRQNKQQALEKCETTAEIPDAQLLSKNRLLALEQELLQLRRLDNNYSKLSPVNTEEKTQPKKNREPVQSQAFDTGEAIFLEYNASFYQPNSINSVENFLSFHLQNDDYSFQVETVEPENRQGINSLSHSSSRLKPTVHQISIPLEPNIAVTAKLDSLIYENSNKANTNPEKNQLDNSPLQRTLVISQGIDSLADENLNIASKLQEPQKKNERHAIFDQMGINMAFANSFDLGTVELEMQFDEFDRVLDKQEKQSNNPVSEDLQTRFDEFDRALDKAENPLCLEIPDFLEKSGISVPHSSEKGCNLAEQQSIVEAVRLNDEIENEQQAIAFTECYAVEPSYENVNAPLQLGHQEATLLKRNTSTNLKSSQTVPELNLGMRMLLLRSCLKFISQVLWLIKFLSQTEVSFHGLTPCLKMIPQPIEKVDDFIPSNLNSQTSILLLPAQKFSSKLNQRK